MSFFGSSPWTDAAAYGEGAGQALSQGLLQLPQQRYQLALQQKQMEQAMQQRQLMGMLAQQKQNELNQYRQGLLEQRNLANTNTDQWHQMMVELQRDRASRPMIVPAGASVLMPLSGGAGVGQPTGQALTNTPPNPQIPGYTIQQAPQRLPAAETDNQSLANTLKALELYGQFSRGGTNMTPQQQWGANQSSNMVVNPTQFMQRGGQQQQGMPMQQSTNQPLRVLRYNPASGQLE